VSVIVEFFRGTPAQAAAALESGPEEGPRTFLCENVDVFDALIEWESLVSGTPVDELLESGSPPEIASDDGGSMALQVSEARAEWLAAATAPRIAWLAGAWEARAEPRGRVAADVGPGSSERWRTSSRATSGKASRSTAGAVGPDREGFRRSARRR
jgi:hypothetical protein